MQLWQMNPSEPHNVFNDSPPKKKGEKKRETLTVHRLEQTQFQEQSAREVSRWVEQVETNSFGLSHLHSVRMTMWVSN